MGRREWEMSEAKDQTEIRSLEVAEVSGNTEAGLEVNSPSMLHAFL